MVAAAAHGDLEAAVAEAGAGRGRVGVRVRAQDSATRVSKPSPNVGSASKGHASSLALGAHLLHVNELLDGLDSALLLVAFGARH